MPYAYVAGHDAGRAGAAEADNPYALCLPTDNEARAALWDEGLRLGRRATQAVPSPTTGRIERGEVDPRISAPKRIAAGLGISPASLLHIVD